MEQTQIQKLHERVQALEERDSNRHAETTPKATPPSQRRSSVASTELLQLEHVLTAPARYHVDAITESQHCHLMAQWQNFKVKAAVGSVLPTEPGATYHCRPIPEGYARVMVDEITEGFEDLQLDHPTGEGETRLGSSLKTPCLWRKELINLPNWTPPPPPPPPASQGTPPPPPPPPPVSDDQGTRPLLLRRVAALRLLLRLCRRARAASPLLLRLVSKGGRDLPPLRLLRRVVVLLLRLVRK